MKKYILFDFDGVIVDTFDLSFDIHKNHQATNTITAEEYREFFNGNIYHSVHQNKEHSFKNEAVKKFFSHYEPELQRMSCISGMAEVIKNLSADYEMIIVSSTVGSMIENFLQKHNLQNYFVAIYGPEIEVNKSKKIKTIFEKFQTTAHDCIFITDTLGDIKEARAAGVDSIAVSWGYHSLATLELGNPLAIADKPSELPNLVRTFLS